MEEQGLLQQLETTAFACSSLIRLSGGSANYVYLGILMHAMPTKDDDLDMESVIVKHSLGHVPGNAGFKLDLSRCSIEHTVLEYLNQSSLLTMKVKVPVTHFLDLNAHRGIAIQQDFCHSTDMASIIRSTELSGLWTQSQAVCTSQEVGRWLRHFHEWASEPEQAVFRSKVGYNGHMQRLKHKVTYGAFIDVLKNFHDIMEKNFGVLERVKERAELELHDLISGKDGPDRGMIHGDCWMGKGFINGYGEIDNELAFRTAIHTGMQLLGWYNRRAPSATVKGTKEQILSAAKISTHFIVGGWERERQWFQVKRLAKSCISL
ncbi:carboxypeptidase [Fusarium pseudocircinatum]|uniref:Carboxypeptidase n=1 Tax=Fusarium pseudocircinatum TaxID=56676 RepID=A0A8H5UME5_9HYPO|nr:carboxypeptidase [Fusarium pseudocircinatum]